MSGKDAFYRREFLNKETWHSHAHIIAAVPKVDGRKSEQWVDSPSLSLADCSRLIDLDFGWYDEKELDNSLYKLDLLYKIITQFRSEFKKQAEKQRNNIRKSEAKRKK